ncbi:MAG: peroxidase family protein [Pseudomonadota bacterium]
MASLFSLKTACLTGLSVGLIAVSASAATIPSSYFQDVADGTIPANPVLPAVSDLTQLERVAPSAYDDGFNSPGNANAPNPRALSNALADIKFKKTDAVPLSNLAVAFSQLMASHEIAKSPTLAGQQNSIAITVDPSDPVAQTGAGTPVMFQQRSTEAPGTGVPGTPREQLNDVTQAFDGSTVYGSNKTRQDALRTLDGTGKMKTSSDGGLPEIAGRPSAGDVRADENVVLESLHVLFVQEHNRLAEVIAAGCSAEGRSCSGEEIFEGARSIVAATQEKIFYDEFLPIFLGEADLTKLIPDASLLNKPAAVLNEFTAAAGRIGHTQVPDTVTAGLPGGVMREDKIEDCLFSQTCVAGATLDEMLYGAGTLKAAAVDTNVTDGLRNGQVNGFGQNILIDLLATNINRGRDHGLASYEAVRAALGFASMPLTDLLSQDLLDLYPTGNVDLLVALFAEKRGANEYLGETGKALWALQFEQLRSSTGLLFDTKWAGYFDNMSMAQLIANNTSLSASDFGRSAFIAPVPLPASLAFLLAGLGGFGVLRRLKAA